jgi:DNA-binding transcriptional ArsR family regulator
MPIRPENRGLTVPDGRVKINIDNDNNSHGKQGSFMPTSRASLITHPVRARILTALLGRQLTTQQIAQLLPDVPLPSVYRHMRLLVDAGVLKAVDEVRVKGAPTQVYAVQPGQTSLSPADVRDATRADHQQYLTTLQNKLAEKLRTSLEQTPFDPGKDPIHCLMESLHLSPDEYREFQQALQAFLEPWRARPPAADRRRLLFAHLLLPDSPDPPR